MLSQWEGVRKACVSILRYSVRAVRRSQTMCARSRLKGEHFHREEFTRHLTAVAVPRIGKSTGLVFGSYWNELKMGPAAPPIAARRSGCSKALRRTPFASSFCSSDASNSSTALKIAPSVMLTVC